MCKVEEINIHVETSRETSKDLSGNVIDFFVVAVVSEQSFLTLIEFIRV